MLSLWTLNKISTGNLILLKWRIMSQVSHNSSHRKLATCRPTNSRSRIALMEAIISKLCSSNRTNQACQVEIKLACLLLLRVVLVFLMATWLPMMDGGQWLMNLVSETVLKCTHSKSPTTKTSITTSISSSSKPCKNSSTTKWWKRNAVIWSDKPRALAISMALARVRKILATRGPSTESTS